MVNKCQWGWKDNIFKLTIRALFMRIFIQVCIFLFFCLFFSWRTAHAGYLILNLNDDTKSTIYNLPSIGKPLVFSLLYTLVFNDKNNYQRVFKCMFFFFIYILYFIIVTVAVIIVMTNINHVAVHSLAQLY